MNNLEIGRCPKCSRNLVIRNQDDQIIGVLPEKKEIWVVYENVDRAEGTPKREHRMGVSVCSFCIEAGNLSAQEIHQNMVDRGEDSAIYNAQDGITPVSIEVRK